MELNKSNVEKRIDSLLRQEGKIRDAMKGLRKLDLDQHHYFGTEVLHQTTALQNLLKDKLDETLDKVKELRRFRDTLS